MRKGFKHSEETKRKMSEYRFKKPLRYWLGKKRSIETRRKIGESNKGSKGRKANSGSFFWKGKHLPEEMRKNISKALKGRVLSRGTLGKHHSEEAKEKIRKSCFKYAQKTDGIIYPRIGKNEKNTLDKLEQKLKYRIIRQYEVGGYYLDGYVPEINLAIEVDEKRHKNTKGKDLEREEFIKQKLGCQFLRIKDYC